MLQFERARSKTSLQVQSASLSMKLFTPSLGFMGRDSSQTRFVFFTRVLGKELVIFLGGERVIFCATAIHSLV